MKTLNRSELNMVVDAIDYFWRGMTSYTCCALDHADQRRPVPSRDGGYGISPLRYRYAKFFDQSDEGLWALNMWAQFRHGERAMLLATFLVLKGVVPGEES